MTATGSPIMEVDSAVARAAIERDLGASKKMEKDIPNVAPNRDNTLDSEDSFAQVTVRKIEVILLGAASADRLGAFFYFLPHVVQRDVLAYDTEVDLHGCVAILDGECKELNGLILSWPMLNLDNTIVIPIVITEVALVNARLYNSPSVDGMYRVLPKPCNGWRRWDNFLS